VPSCILSMLSPVLFFSLIPPPRRSPLFPYTTLFRSRVEVLYTHFVNVIVRRVRTETFLPVGVDAGPAAASAAGAGKGAAIFEPRSEEHTSELQSLTNLVCRLLLEKKKKRLQPRQDEPVNWRRKKEMNVGACAEAHLCMLTLPGLAVDRKLNAVPRDALVRTLQALA